MENIAGSDYGTVRPQQKGYGEAFLLDGPKTEVGVYVQGLKDQAAMKQKAQALLEKKQAKKDKFWQDFLKEDKTSPSFKYREYIDKMAEDMESYGLDLYEEGVDMSRDEGWMKKTGKFKSAVAAIKGIEAERQKNMTLIASNPDKIDKASAQAIIDFYDQDPAAIIEQGGSPPLLKTKTPDYDVLKATNAINVEIDKIGKVPPPPEDAAGYAEYKEFMEGKATMALDTNKALENGIKQILEREKGQNEEAYNEMKEEAEAKQVSHESIWLRNHLINTKSSLSLEEAIATKLPAMLTAGEQFYTDETGAKHQKDPTEHFEAMISNLVTRNPNGWGVGIKTYEQALDKARELGKTLMTQNTAKKRKSIASGDGDGGNDRYYGVKTTKGQYLLDLVSPIAGVTPKEYENNPILGLDHPTYGDVISVDATNNTITFKKKDWKEFGSKKVGATTVRPIDSAIIEHFVGLGEAGRIKKGIEQRNKASKNYPSNKTQGDKSDRLGIL